MQAAAAARLEALEKVIEIADAEAFMRDEGESKWEYVYSFFPSHAV